MKVLIVVDVQNDFLPGGTLAVKDGNKIIPIINELANSGKYDKVFASQDWHDDDHTSFADCYGAEPFTFVEAAEQVVWPRHCVKGTKGAELSPLLDQSNINAIIRKGMDRDVESYSVFMDNDKQTRSGLCKLIEAECIDPANITIDFVGIATDVCVLNSALDGRIFNWEGTTRVVRVACAGVSDEGSIKAFNKMTSAGIQMIELEEV